MPAARKQPGLRSDYTGRDSHKHIDTDSSSEPLQGNLAAGWAARTAAFPSVWACQKGQGNQPEYVEVGVSGNAYWAAIATMGVSKSGAGGSCP